LGSRCLGRSIGDVVRPQRLSHICYQRMESMAGTASWFGSLSLAAADSGSEGEDCQATAGASAGALSMQTASAREEAIERPLVPKSLREAQASASSLSRALVAPSSSMDPLPGSPMCARFGSSSAQGCSGPANALVAMQSEDAACCAPTGQGGPGGRRHSDGTESSQAQAVEPKSLVPGPEGAQKQFAAAYIGIGPHWQPRASCAMAAARALATANRGVTGLRDDSVVPQVLTTRVGLCVSTFSLGRPVDIDAVASKVPNATLGRKRKGSGVVHIRCFKEPRWAAAVFKMGKVKLSTIFDGDKARLAAKRAARLLKVHLDGRISFKDFRMLNVMVRAQLAFRIHIEDFATEAHMAATEAHMAAASSPALQILRYEPHGPSPHVYVEVPGHGVNIFVHQSGMLRACKSRSSDEAIAAMKALVPALSRHHMWW